MWLKVIASLNVIEDKSYELKFLRSLLLIIHYSLEIVFIVSCHHDQSASESPFTHYYLCRVFVVSPGRFRLYGVL
jgi:hypothetical protein